jgi:hypothetical protein
MSPKKMGGSCFGTSSALRATGLILAAATLSAPVLAQGQAAGPSLTSTTVVSGRENTWDMAFLPDGTMFFTEKCRGLSVRLPSGTINQLLGMKDIQGYRDTAADLFCSGQAGMSGVAVDPDFASNRFIYVFSASSLTAPGSNRVLRMTVNADLTQVSNRTDIVADIPYKPNPSDHPFGDPGAHNGGRLRFGPADGFLYVTTGDTHNGVVPQSPTLPRRQGAADRPEWAGRAGQQRPAGLRSPHLHLRPSQPAGHLLPTGQQPGLHGGERPLAQRRGDAAQARRQCGLGSAAERQRPRRLPRRVLWLQPEPDGGDAPRGASGLHADDRHAGLPRRDAAGLEQ